MGHEVSARKSGMRPVRWMAVLLLWASCVLAQSAERHLQAGLAAKQAGDLVRAAAELRAAVAADPSHAQAHSALGWTYVAAGKQAAAIEHLNRAAELAGAGEDGRRDAEAVQRMGGSLTAGAQAAMADSAPAAAPEPKSRKKGRKAKDAPAPAPEPAPEAAPPAAAAPPADGPPADAAPPADAPPAAEAAAPPDAGVAVPAGEEPAPKKRMKLPLAPILVVGGGVLLAAVLVIKKKGQGEVEESV